MFQTVYIIVLMVVHHIMCEVCDEVIIDGGNNIAGATKVEYIINDLNYIQSAGDATNLEGFLVELNGVPLNEGFGDVNGGTSSTVTSTEILKTDTFSGTFDPNTPTHLKSLKFEYSDMQIPTNMGSSTDGINSFAVVRESGQTLQAITIYHEASVAILGLKFTLCPGSSVVDSDPHFIIRLAGSDLPICFNYDVRPGSVIQLVHDVETGLTVNAKLVSKFTPGRKLQTWMGKIAIFDKQTTVLLSPKKIWFNSTSIPWENTLTDINLPNQAKMTIIEKKKVILDISDHVKFAILRHTFGTNGEQPDYLGFVILNQGGLSKSVHGLIGQFRHETVAVEKSLMTASSKGHNATVSFLKPPKRDKIPVDRALRYDTYRQKNISCWFVHNNGHGLLMGNYMDYIVPHLKYKSLAGLIRKKYYLND